MSIYKHASALISEVCKAMIKMPKMNEIAYILTNPNAF
ncbi:hypothetical protein BH11BAC4_BH11BAC4_16560 [soil metagenome]